MPLYFDSKELKCGYLGTKPLSKAYFSTQEVCTTQDSEFPEFPPPNPAARYSMMLKSSVDLMPAWTTTGLTSLISDSSSWYSVNWKLVPLGVDKEGKFDYELYCIGTVTMVQFARNHSSVVSIQIAKGVDHNGNLIKCKYYYSFIDLPVLKTFQVLPNTVGAVTNMCRMFWNCRSLEYVDFAKTFFSTSAVDYELMFYDTPRLRFVSYINTRHTVSNGRRNMFSNSNPHRPSIDERSALMSSYGSRFQFDVSRMSNTDSWKRSPKTSYRYYRVTFDDKANGANHHSIASNIYAYVAGDGHDAILNTSPEDLAFFGATPAASGRPASNLRDNTNSYWKTYHWGNGHFEWQFKVPQAVDSFRIQTGGAPSNEIGRHFLIQGSNVSKTGPWTTVKEYRTRDDYGNFSGLENRTILIDD